VNKLTSPILNVNLGKRKAVINFRIAGIPFLNVRELRNLLNGFI